MPLISQNAALTNPMVVDKFTVNRRTQTVNGFGIASTTVEPFTPVYGTVYPSDENDLKRWPDLQVTDKALTVITRFALRNESETSIDGSISSSPDIVVWPLVNGDNYLVRKILDWSQYGTGFIFAICTSMDLVDQPPATE